MLPWRIYFLLQIMRSHILDLTLFVCKKSSPISTNGGMGELILHTLPAFS